MHIYKYGAQYIADVFARKLIRVSAATELNDPFELSPHIDASRFTLKRATQFLRLDDQINYWYRIEARSLGFTNKKQYKAHYLRTLPDRARPLLSKIPDNVEQARRDFAATFSKHWRLFCASMINDSILMWSHYAAQHTGAVIKFDTTQPPFVQLDDLSCLPVQYSDRKVEFFYKPKSVHGFQGALAAVTRTKAASWAYEQEIRVAFPITACRNGQYVPISPSAIRHVYFGARSSDPYRAEIEGLLRTPDFAHVGISKADLSPEHYALTFRSIRDETTA